MDPLNYIHTDGAGTLLEVNELFIGSCILGSVIYYRTVEVPIKGVIHIYFIKKLGRTTISVLQNACRSIKSQDLLNLNFIG
jgi:hypothetical protein